MFTGIHHISILVSTEESIDFYKKLGFVESFRKIRKTDIIVLLDGYGMQLEVFIDSSHPGQSEGKGEPLGLRHFALKTDDLKKTIVNLEKQSIKVGEIDYDWIGTRYCYITDPDGGLIELHE